MTNAIKVLLQMQSVFLQLVSTLHIIHFFFKTIVKVLTCWYEPLVFLHQSA
jgi:hypothetical protein